MQKLHIMLLRKNGCERMIGKMRKIKCKPGPPAVRAKCAAVERRASGITGAAATAAGGGGGGDYSGLSVIGA